MVLFIPILILLLFGIGIQVLGRTLFNIVQSWIFAVIGSILAWLSFFIVKIFQSGQTVTSFFPSESLMNFQMIFKISDKNWVFGFLLLTLLIVILLMDAKWLTEKNSLIAWSGVLFIGASGLLTIMSGSVIPFLLTSALLDIQLFTSQIIIQKEDFEVRITIFDFLFKIIGTFIIMFGFGLNGEIDLLLVSAGMGLRLGAIPFGSEFPRTETISSRLAILFEMVVPISCFAFLNQMQVMNSEFPGKAIYFVVLIIFIFSNVMKIITHQQSRNGMRAWMSAFSGLAVMLIINGQIDYIQPLSIVFCVLGGLLAFELYGSSRFKIGIIILLLSMIGLPYTPSYGIWATTLQERPTFFLFFYPILLTFFILVVFHTIISIPAKGDQKDSWVKIASIISPIILLIVPWILEIWIWPAKTDEYNLISPAIFLAMLTFLIYLDLSEKTKKYIKNYLNSYKRFLSFITSGLEKVLSLAWIARILKFVNQTLSNLINIFVRVLEGDGGLLWAFVFLILISSILLTYRIFS